MQLCRDSLSNAAYAPETRPYCVINSACERHESVICVLFTNFTGLIFMVPLGLPASRTMHLTHLTGPDRAVHHGVLTRIRTFKRDKDSSRAFTVRVTAQRFLRVYSNISRLAKS
jgi:hypothetical protein